MNEHVCPTCNNPILPGALYCDNCGKALDNQPAADTKSLNTEELKEPQPAAEAGGSSKCLNCGTENAPGAAFCESCGLQLNPAAADQLEPAVIPSPELAPYPASSTPAGTLTGRLVLQKSNLSLLLPAGRVEAIIGREDPATNVHPEIDLDPHGGHQAGVGRQHAKLLVSGGQLCLVDLNSVNGTFVNHKKLTPGQPQPIQDGDEIRLGRVVLVYHAN